MTFTNLQPNTQFETMADCSYNRYELDDYHRKLVYREAYSISTNNHLAKGPLRGSLNTKDAVLIRQFNLVLEPLTEIKVRTLEITSYPQRPQI